MSGGNGAKSIGRRIFETALLAVLVALLFISVMAVPALQGQAGTIAALGLLLLGGSVVSGLLEIVGLPHLTGYLLAGILAGPHLMGLVDHKAVQDLNGVNQLALSLIALAGGAELRLSVVRKGLKSLVWATVVQHGLVALVMTGVFMAAGRYLPFTRGMGLSALFGVSMLWGVLSVTRSPSATLGILSQTRATGPLATFTLTFVMCSDVLIVVMLVAGLTIARPFIEAGSTLSLSAFSKLGHEVLGSVALGTTLGLVLIAYLRFVGKNLLLVFATLGLVLTQAIDYLRFDWLLTFLTAGFLVQNLSNQGAKFVEGIERMGEIVYVIFFAVAGAHLDLPLLGRLWPAAVTFCAMRAISTFGASQLASRLAQDQPAIRRWGWSGMISQAGLALGVAATLQKEFPAFGAGFGALAVASVAINEMVGPVLFKGALDRTGETKAGQAEEKGDRLLLESD
jgi:Kef-type K+ transport system membrane component KefB